MKSFLKKNSNIIITIFFLFLLFIFIDDIIDKSIIDNTAYNSYELQARAWLNGSTHLDHDYVHLELAIYNGNYYVSFPPFPSVVLLPFILIFQDHVPTNLIAFIIFAAEVVLLYKIVKRFKNSEFMAILLALGFTVGTNLLSISMDSGVWFFAQLINNFLCILAIDAFLKDKKALVYFFLALAVGCRPFSAIYMVMFFIYYLIKERDKTIIKRIIDNIKPLIPAMIVAILYMTYNYIRFDNILEFGHNYLPEFVNAQDGQFSLNYFVANFKQLLFGAIHVKSNLNLSYEMPFSFIIANPVVILYLYRSIKNIIKNKKINLLRVMIFITMFINIIFICLHRTLGAWQFGARYTCDILPFIFLAIMTYQVEKNDKIKLDKFEIACLIFGMMLNIFGTIIMYNNIFS